MAAVTDQSKLGGVRGGSTLPPPPIRDPVALTLQPQRRGIAHQCQVTGRPDLAVSYLP